MKKLSTVLLLLLSLLIFVSCGAPGVKKDVDHKDYGFYINHKGDLVEKSKIGSLKVIDWYFDPRCPFCVEVESYFEEYKEETLQDRAVIHFMPLNLLSKDKEESLSEVGSSLILAVSKNEPEILKPLMAKLMTTEFLESAKTGPSTEKLKQAYLSSGGKNWDAINAKRIESLELIKKVSKEFADSKYLLSKSPRDYVYVPFITVDNKPKAIEVDKAENIVDQIKELLN